MFKLRPVIKLNRRVTAARKILETALQISSARHTSGTKPVWSEITVHHVFDHSFNTLPRYLPVSPYDPRKEYTTSPLFRSLDLMLYRLNGRKDPISTLKNLPSKEQPAQVYARLLTLVGPQQDTGPSLHTSIKRSGTPRTPLLQIRTTNLFDPAQ
jgi:hypothetical protein